MTSYNLLPVFAMQSLSRTFAPESSSSTLYRDFLNQRSLNGPVSEFRKGPDISFVRNSYSSYYNSFGVLQSATINEPRFNYSPTGEYLGFLVEDQATNLIPYSQDFNTNWSTLTGSVSLSSDIAGILAPNNTETATLLLPTTANNFHAITWGPTPFPFQGGPTITDFYTRSIFIKKEKAQHILVSCSPNVSAFAAGQPNFETVANIFDFDSENFTKFSVPFGTVEKLNNGWFRISLTRTSANVNASYLTIGICNGPDFENAKFIGEENNLSGVYVWGGQVEKGIFTSSYIPTSSTEVTRAADNAFIEGKNFSTFYNLTAGTYITTASQNNILDRRAFATFINTNGTKYLSLETTLSGDKHIFVNTSGVTLSSSTIISNQFYTLCTAFKNNDFIFIQDGLIQDSTTGGTIPGAPSGISRFRLGQFNNSRYLNGHIQQINYIPTRMPNEQIIDLSKLYDIDAKTYFTQIETIDGQSLESSYKDAINEFVLGLKNDNIWSNITGASILAGARTLSGALTPLKGPEPTPINFLPVDYTRSGGLSGDGITKSLRTNVNITDRPSTSSHYSVYISKPVTVVDPSPIQRAILGTSFLATTAQDLMYNVTTSPNNLTFISRQPFGIGAVIDFTNQNTPGFKGSSRTGTTRSARAGGVTSSSTSPPGVTQGAPRPIFLYSASQISLGVTLSAPPPSNFTNCALTFYSIGSAVNLETLENRVNTLMQTISTLT